MDGGSALSQLLNIRWFLESALPHVRSADAGIAHVCCEHEAVQVFPFMQRLNERLETRVKMTAGLRGALMDRCARGVGILYPTIPLSVLSVFHAALRLADCVPGIHPVRFGANHELRLAEAGK